MKLKALSIKKKFVLILFIFMLVPTCVVSGWMYKMVSNSWIQKEYSSQSNELGSILRTAELQLEEYEDAVYDIYEEDGLLKTLQLSLEERIPLDYVNVTDALRNMQGAKEYIESVYLFTDYGEVFFRDSKTCGKYEKLYSENGWWEEQIREKNGAVVWLPAYNIQNNQKEYQYFSCAMMMKNLASTWQPCGILVVNIDLSLFDRLFELLGQQDDSTTYLIADDEGRIIWSNKLNAAESLDQEFFHTVQEQENSCGVQKYGEESCVVTAFQSEYNGWNYISMKNRAEVMKTGNWVLTVMVVQLALILLFSIIGAFILQWYIIRPIQKMVVTMSVPEKELVGQRIHIDQEDEIGKLYQSFNEMNEKIENFIEKNNEMNKREKEYQIQALNAQINPHFIYNTLDTLHWMALDIPAPDICRLIDSFSDILRYSISKRTEIVTLEDELQCIRNYITIYEERYEKSFGRFEIDERIYPYRTFKMLLQPIVENCIVHGFAQNMEHAVICITGELSENEAVVRIQDNGCGIAPERISYILSRDSDRVGLSNINQRLKLLYGEEYGLKVVSTKAEGTEVILRFPKRSLEL